MLAKSAEEKSRLLAQSIAIQLTIQKNMKVPLKAKCEAPPYLRCYVVWTVDNIQAKVEEVYYKGKLEQI